MTLLVCCLNVLNPGGMSRPLRKPLLLACCEIFFLARAAENRSGLARLDNEWETGRGNRNNIIIKPLL